jgi:hypothetical protein
VLVDADAVFLLIVCFRGSEFLDHKLRLTERTRVFLRHGTCRTDRLCCHSGRFRLFVIVFSLLFVWYNSRHSRLGLPPCRPLFSSFIYCPVFLY